MNRKTVGVNIALMAVFGAIGLTLFTEDVKTVQIIGLFVSGAVFGAALGAIVSAFRTKKTQGQVQS